MHGRVIGILEARAGEHLMELVTRRGGLPLLAPALEEVPDVDPGAIAELVDAWRTHPFAVAIFQTGVGTRALFQATDALGLSGELLALLASSVVIVRGPKPVGELSSRGVAIARRAASPFTTQSVLDCLGDIELRDARVVVQRYGAVNHVLRAALETRGATVDEVSTYRWALPVDIQPLLDLIRALHERRVDAVVFTSAVQIHHLMQVAQHDGQAPDLAADLNRCIVASVGPVCSRALMEHGVRPAFEANPPKLGPLLAGLEAALSAGAPDGR